MSMPRSRHRVAAPEPDDDDHCKPFVHEGLDVKTLYFSISAIQSRMQIQRPEALELDYTRTMLGFLAFEAEPRRIAMIGLGGGSMAKWCHRHLPRTEMVAVEVNPHVIALREQFMVPPDGPRFRVVQDDGAHFVAHTAERFDVLMVDAFDREGLPRALSTQRFYDDCFDALTPGGLLVANLHARDKSLPACIERMRRSSGGHLLRVDEPEDCNTVVFARKGAALPPIDRQRSRRPAGMAPEAWDEIAPAIARIRHYATQETQREACPPAAHATTRRGV